MNRTLTLKVTVPAAGFRYVSDVVLEEEIERVFDDNTARDVQQKIDNMLLGSSGPPFGTYTQDLKSIFDKLNLKAEFIHEKDSTVVYTSGKYSGI